MVNMGKLDQETSKHTSYDKACTVRHYTFGKHTLRETLSLDCRLGFKGYSKDQERCKFDLENFFSFSYSSALKYSLHKP